MPARLYFSNSLDTLVERLLPGLVGLDPFVAPSIATPTPALRGWLQIRLAERLGIVANIDFPQLEKLLWQRLAELDHFRNALGRQPARLLEPMNFQGLILTQLRKNPPAALRHYLHPDASEPYDEARRLCQLAGRLAALFREYEYSRVSEGGFKGLTETWSRGEACFEQYLRGLKFSAGQKEQVRKLETWQREIYQALFCEQGLRDRWGQATGVYRYTLPQYAEMVLGQNRTVGRIAKEPPVFHLFGLSHISPFHRALIHRLADADRLGSEVSNFEIYALNPCAEYWEDATSPRRKLSETELQEEELPQDLGENVLLSRFGKPGRETIRLWNQITDYDFFGDFRESEGSTLLATLQNAVLRRSGSLRIEQRVFQDTSLQIWSAPDRHAEVEAAKAHIGELLLADSSLKLEDIAVIPADVETYLPIVEMTFQGGNPAGFIPHCLPEAGMLRESALLRGFRDLLELGSGPFRRASLLAWLENSAVQRKLRVGPGVVASFGKFLEEAGFQEGWDEEHRQSQDATPGSLSTLGAATERALLGLILDSSDSALEEAGLHPAASASAGWDREELSQCLDLLDRLRLDLRPLQSQETLSFQDWSECLQRWLGEYFLADPDLPIEAQAEKDLLRFCADLKEWSSWDSAAEAVTKEGNAGVTHHVISVLLEDHFREPRAARMPFLAGGVRIGSLSALRSLPFRHVYLLGFNAEDFPGSREASPLDLRGYRRVLGEADPASRDLYAFLEVLCTASDRVILSYVRRNPLRDSVRQPSQALAFLAAYLEENVLSRDKGKSAVFSQLELNADGRYAATAMNPAEKGASEKWQASPRPRLETLRLKALANLPEDEAARLVKSRIHRPAPPRWASLPKEEKPLWDLQSLAVYLQNPAQHACFKHFRLYAPLEDTEEESSPLFLDKWEMSRLLEPAVRADLLEPGKGEAASRRALQRKIWNGMGPPHPYSDLELERVDDETQTLLKGSLEDLRETLGSLDLRFSGTLRLGGQGTRAAEPPLLDLPAFDTSSLGVHARLTCTMPFFFTGHSPEKGWGLLLGSHESENLTAYLFHLCATALDSGKNFHGPGYLLSLNGKVRPLPSLTAETAAEDLTALLKDFSHAPDFDHLPLRIVEKFSGAPATEVPQDGMDWKERIETREREEVEASFAPPGSKKRILRAIGPEVPRDAGEKIRRRILPFLRWEDLLKKAEA